MPNEIFLKSRKIHGIVLAEKIRGIVLSRKNPRNYFSLVLVYRSQQQDQ